MKLKSLLQPMTMAVVVLVSLSESIQAQTTPKFFCGTYQGHSATLVRTPRGSVPLIVWMNDDNLSNTQQLSEEYCRDVSGNFEHFNNNGQLKYLKAGVINGVEVICATGNSSDVCNSNTVLLTLPAEMNANEALSTLINSRVTAFAPPLYIDVSKIENRGSHH